MQSALEYRCSAGTLAKSILDVWLCGDRYRMRLELERITATPVPKYADDEESDQIELLKTIASAMAESTELASAQPANPRVIAWLDLLDHLSGEKSSPGRY